VTELYSAHPVMFKSKPFGFILALLLVPVGIGLIIFLVWYIRNKSSKLTVTDKEILFEQGLLSKDRSELSISSIRTVKVKQTVFNRMFGTGTVEIYTAGDSPEIVAVGLPDANKIRELV